MTGTRPNVLMLGTAEWDSPIATNQHYVARELASVADVWFVESLGLRRPTLSPADVRRMAGRVRRAARAGTKVPALRRPRPEGVRVVSPLVVPVHRAPTRPINRRLLQRAVATWSAAPHPRVLWTFTPVTYGLESSADVVLYHCVDLLHTVKGVDATAVLRGERSIAPRTGTAIGTSAAVAAHLREAGFRRVLELPNVADVGVFTRRAQPASRRRRAVLFAGNLTAAKLDVPLLESVATALRGEAELILAGPVAADFTGHLERLIALGATHVGSLSLDDLAKLSGECAVGLIPYSLNDYTAGVSPLKCFEYLAAGLAIASTALPEVVRLAGTNQHVRVAEPGAIPALLRELLQQAATADADAAIAARIGSAEGNGWQTRGEQLRDLLQAELAGAGKADKK